MRPGNGNLDWDWLVAWGRRQSKCDYKKPAFRWRAVASLLFPSNVGLWERKEDSPSSPSKVNPEARKCEYPAAELYQAPCL